MPKLLFKRMLWVVCFLVSPLILFAQDAPKAKAMTSEEMTLYVLVTISLLILVFTVFALVLSVQVIVLFLRQGTKDPQDAQTFWQIVWGLKPLSKEKDLIIQESHDGIYELDNPVPVWFNVLFYGTISIGIVYMLVYHVWNIGDLQDVEYIKEVQYAEVQKEEYLKKIASGLDEKTVKFVSDKKSLENGKKIYIENCATCHGEKGEGKLGPNLTDNYWLHGGKIADIFKTIKYGVPTKGMISWSKKLNPLLMQEVASYIMTLKGTNPPNAKEPQGVEESGSDKQVSLK
jgi:cytochrome c oxidase cbb3-type subunit III